MKNRVMAFGSLIVVALVAFEVFNFSTTEFALANLLGDVSFAGLQWATILAIAFCGIDFAGIARLFSPELSFGNREGNRAGRAAGLGDSLETWYLLGAWFLAATMNAGLTWWGVSLALVNHPALGNEILSREELLSGLPVFVAVLVWVIRILLIGTVSIAGNRLFTQFSAASMRTGRGDSRAAPLATQSVRVLGDPDVREWVGQRGSSPATSVPTQRRPSASDPSRSFRPAPKPNEARGGGSNGSLEDLQD